MRLSFSQLKLFESCPKHYHYRYVLKIPESNIETKYVDFGSAMHECAEEYYKKLEITSMFIQDKFDEYKLDGRMDRELFMKCVLNITYLDLNPKHIEDKVFLKVGDHHFVGYIDLITNDDHIIDWKSGTYSAAKAADYEKQLWCYSYLFWRKYGRPPKKCSLYFPKNNKWHTVTFDMEQIMEVEKWILRLATEIEELKSNPEAIWIKNPKACFFCGYKQPCKLQPDPRKEHLNFIINIDRGMCYLKGDVTELLNKGIEKELSYDLKDKYWIQQNYLKKYGGLRPKNFERIGRKYLYNKTHCAFRIGHLPKVKKVIQDYAEYTKCTYNLKEENNTLHLNHWKPNNKLLGGKTLRDYQEEAVSSFLENKFGFLEVATGGGKTLITAEIIRTLGVKTLWICDRKELVKQTKETFEDELGFNVGEIGGGKAKDLDSPVIVSTVQTLSRNRERFVELFKEINLVIIDEAHHASCETYVKVISALGNAIYRLGTTGTVKRDDGNDMILESLIGPVIYKISADQLIEQGYLIKPKIKFIPMPFYDTEGTYSEVYDECVVRDVERNNKIIDIVKNSQAKQILVLVNRIEHGDILQNKIPNSIFIHGSLDIDKRELYLKKFTNKDIKVLIGTASIFSEGINIPSLDVIINAAANKGSVKTIQSLGRILRLIDGKKEAIYYDFLDEALYLKEAAKARIKALKDQGHEVE